MLMIGFWLFRFFKESSEEERGHAEKLMEYQVIEFDFILYNLFFSPIISYDVDYWLPMFFKYIFSEQKGWKSEVADYGDAAFWVWPCW